VLFLFAFSLVVLRWLGVRLSFGALLVGWWFRLLCGVPFVRGFRGAFLCGLVRGFRWGSFLSVVWLSLWLGGSLLFSLRGLSGALVGWAAGFCGLLFCSVVVVVLLSPRPVVVPVVPSSVVVVCSRLLRLSGGSCRLVSAPCPFSVVLVVSVPV